MKTGSVAGESNRLELPTMILRIPRKSEIAGLSSPLGTIIELYHELGLVGEERNIAQVFLTGITRHLPRTYRRHLIPKGSSGSGKTTLVRIVLEAFRGDVEEYTRITGAGLDRKEGSMEHKILFIEQLDGSQPVQLRYLMTEGKLTILFADRNGVSSRREFDGGPVIMSTAVGTVSDPQLTNRVCTLEIDETEAQTERITHRKLENWTNIHRDQEDSALRLLQEIDKECTQLGSHIKEIKIPFAGQLEQVFPKTLPMRRGIDRLLSLVAAIAFLKAALEMRPQVKVKGQESVYVVALPEDLNDALYCLGEAFSDSLSNLTERYQEAYEALCNNSSASSKEMGRILQIHENTAREHLNELIANGLATRTQSKGIYRYQAQLKSRDSLQLKLHASYTETDLRNWFKQQFPNNDADLIIPEQTGFECLPVQGCFDSESSLGTVRQIERETGTNDEIVPNNASEDDNSRTVIQRQ